MTMEKTSDNPVNLTLIIVTLIRSDTMFHCAHYLGSVSCDDVG